MVKDTADLHGLLQGLYGWLRTQRMVKDTTDCQVRKRDFEGRFASPKMEKKLVAVNPKMEK